MAVVVAERWDGMIAPADGLAAGARSVAIVATVLVIGVSGLVLWEFYTLGANRRQKHIFGRHKNELEHLRCGAAAMVARSQLDAERLRVLINDAAGGIAVFDAKVQLIQWNNPFHQRIGIVLRQDMPLDMLLREQAVREIVRTCRWNRGRDRPPG